MPANRLDRPLQEESSYRHSFFLLDSPPLSPVVMRSTNKLLSARITDTEKPCSDLMRVDCQAARSALKDFRSNSESPQVGRELEGGHPRYGLERELVS
jgi:hypothetical protein